MRLIDADAFDKCLEGAEIEAAKNRKYVFRSAIDTIRGNLANFPTVNQWISCGDRLPEIGEYVLCSQDNGDVGEGKLLDYGSWLICYDQTCRGSYWVNAWMPLPEPWKEGDQA